MARKKERPTKVVAITPNQIVAFNLSEARALRGWTQEQAAAELEQYVGSRWSKATFSAAERSVDGRRVRQFTADEIVAFSRCFRLPIGFFFMPPRPSQVEQPVVLSTPERHGEGIKLAELLDVIFGTPGEREALSIRLRQFLDELPMAELTDAQDRLTWRAEDAITAVAMKQLARFEEWETSLNDLARQLRSWQSQAKNAAIRDGIVREAADG
ncbi:MAG: hypothetical protein AB7P22_15530 [Vicinamibacterales bacterium]